MTNMFILVDQLISILKNKGFVFRDDGLLNFDKDLFVQEIPNEILPNSHKNESKNKEKCAVCFYQPDIYLYRKLSIEKLKSLGNELTQFQSFIGFDLSIFSDFLYPLQLFYVLLNMLVSAYLTTFGNKLIPNLRADQTDGKSYFDLFKDAPIVACGTLGCSKYKDIKEKNVSIIKDYATNHPNQILIQYGSNLVQGKNILHFKNYSTYKGGVKND